MVYIPVCYLLCCGSKYFSLHFPFYVAVLVLLHASAFSLHSNRLPHLDWSHLTLVNLPFLLYKSPGISLCQYMSVICALFLSSCVIGFVGVFWVETLVLNTL